jgi:hypothetical protein
MENLEKSNQNCDCSGGCCKPKSKSRLWKMLIFCVIMLSAGTIIAAKIIGKSETKTEKCCSVSENASCCPQAVSVSLTEAACCAQPEPSTSAPCCAQPELDK